MAEQVPHTDKPDTKHVHDERDLCPYRRKKRSKYLCNKLVCSKYCFSDHNGHKLKDLQDEGVKQQITDEISSLKDQIEHHINKLEEFGEGLKAKENEMATVVKELRDEIDIQLRNICDEVTRTGENIKENVKKTFINDEENASSGTSDTMKIKKSMKGNKSVEASMKTVPVDRGILRRQVGRLVDRGRMFEVWFDVNDISEIWKEYNSREIECEGVTWRVYVFRYYGDVVIGLKLTKTPQGIKSCKVDCYLKLVNIKDDHQSVVKHDRRTITQGGCFTFINLPVRDIEWSSFNDKQAGFIDDENQFKVEVKLNVHHINEKESKCNYKLNSDCK